MITQCFLFVRYGLTGFTGLLLRKDFMESVELLKRISGMVRLRSLHYLCTFFDLFVNHISLL